MSGKETKTRAPKRLHHTPKAPSLDELHSETRDRFLNEQTAATDKLSHIMADAGIGGLSPKNDPHIENFVEPPTGMSVPVHLTNRRVIPLTNASLINNSKSLILGVDLNTKQTCAFFADHRLNFSNTLRVSLDELYLLMKDDIFNRIQSMSLGNEDITPPFHVGGLEISQYTAKHGGKSVKIKRRGMEYNLFFCASSTWNKFGHLRDLIRMTTVKLTQSASYIGHYLEQFIQEVTAYLERKTGDPNKTNSADLNSLIQNGMDKTSTSIMTMYTLDTNLNDCLDISCLREELKAYHFSLIKDRIFERLVSP